MAGADTPNGDEPQAPPANPFLKFLVYGMGVLIVVMTALLVIGLMLGWHKKGPEKPAAPDPTARTAAANGPVTPLEVPTEKESRLYTLAGDGSRIALHIAAPTGDEIIVVDTIENRVISRIKLVPGGETTPATTP